MGYDTSFHPVPNTLIAERILPWVLGATDEDALTDLVDQAVRIAQVRFEANAWGLGATRAGSDAFDSGRYVWGRPFLVTADTVEGRARQIDAFLVATPAEATTLARDHLDALSAGLADKTVKATDGTLPSPEQLAAQITGHLGLLRKAVRALHDGQESLTFHDQTHDVGPLIGRELARVVLDFAANLRPGWMSRGPTWPSHVLHDHAVRDAFVMNLSLVQPAVEAFPDLPWQQCDSIEENYMVGGCLPAAEVEAAILALAEPEDLERQKLKEALQDSLHRGLPFAEATEVYSGPYGILN